MVSVSRATAAKARLGVSGRGHVAAQGTLGVGHRAVRAALAAAVVTPILLVITAALVALQVGLCVLRQVVRAHEALVALGAGEALLSCVGPEVSL